MPRPLPQSDETEVSKVHRPSASFNSVSTRIIACVFAATLLTAAIVSALCIRSIHADLSGRLTRRFTDLAVERVADWTRLKTELASLMAASTAIDSPWNSELLRARNEAGVPASTILRWHAPDVHVSSDRTTDSLLEGKLPAPPPELALRFDMLALGPPETTASLADQCLAIEVEIPAGAETPLGRLVGCVARDALATALAPNSGEPLSPRVVVTNLRGDVLAAAGPGAPTRLGGSIPIAQLIGNRAGVLSDYSDAAGRAVVGLATPLGRTGWFLAVETEHARAFAPAIAFTRTIFILDVCIVLLFSVLAYKVTVAIMQPIHALSSGAQRILDGHVDHQIPLPAIHDDELGLLTHTFNAMMQKLRSNQIEIERDRIRLAEKNDELQSANEVLSQLSITDGLTKLHNHRYFQDHLTREIKRVSRTNSPLSLILLDIDDFKQLNDSYGHAAGDEVLISLASIMNESARESDLIARYGGEEFVILMPNTDLAGAVHLAEKIRMAVESTRLIIGDRMKPTDVTISLGVALFKGNRREFFAEADRALYRAKAAGKNCVIIAGSDSPSIG